MPFPSHPDAVLSGKDMQAVLRGHSEQMARLELQMVEVLGHLTPGHRHEPGRVTELGHLADRALANAVQSQAPRLSLDFLTSEARRLRTQSPLEDALNKSSNAHVHALLSEGLSQKSLEILQSWMELQVEGRVLQRELERERLIGRVADTVTTCVPPSLSADPAEMLSGVDLAARLGVSDETIRRREGQRELFSILRPGRKRGREYPAFQAWAGIAGEPLARVLTALDDDLGSSAYGFFMSPNDLLGGLSPVETLIGSILATRTLDGGDHLLERDHAVRLEAVVNAARADTAPP